jgi:hypothetical protein
MGNTWRESSFAYKLRPFIRGYSWYERLRYYLLTLGIYEGETPHSLRSGWTIIMALSGLLCMLNDQQ